MPSGLSHHYKKLYIQERSGCLHLTTIGRDFLAKRGLSEIALNANLRSAGLPLIREKIETEDVADILTRVNSVFTTFVDMSDSESGKESPSTKGGI